MDVRSHCPINFGVEHFGDKWSLLIVRDLMFKGKRHYNEFFESEEKVSTSVLGTKLKNLEEVGLISKGSDSVKKSRIRYSLTKKGIALLPFMIELILWSYEQDPKTEAEKEFIKEVQNDRESFIKKTQKKLEHAHLS